MPDDALRERGNSLEEEFFRRKDAELVSRLRSEHARAESRSQMTAVSGIEDLRLLDDLLDHGVTPASFAALMLAPLVAVAWADRRLEDREKAAVLKEATASGMRPGTPEYGLLEEWLAAQPPPSLMSAWEGYARELATNLGVEERREFREALLARANAVSNAAGGFAGRGRTSAEERRVLDAVAAALA
jgi:hypothetical protein